MWRQAICILATLLTISCASQPRVRAEDRTLSFGCDDAVVVASVHNDAEEPVKSDNDLLGHSWFSATLNVKHVVKGPNLPPVLHVRYFSHAAMRQDLDFMLVLKRTGSGYEITTGQLMWLRPHLAQGCV